MFEAQTFVDDVLEHYASEYYDPQEAHEYYLRTRELKGRSPSKKNDPGAEEREGLKYARANIAKAKSAESTQISANQKAEIDKIRLDAQVRIEAIKEHLSRVREYLIAKRKEDVRKISTNRSTLIIDIVSKRDEKVKKILDEANIEISKLPKLPKNASPRVKKMREEKITKIRESANASAISIIEEAKKELGKVNDVAEVLNDISAERTKNDSIEIQEQSSSEVKQLTNQLKSSVENARTKYDGLRKGLMAKYEAIYQRETDAIKQDN